MIFMVLIQKPEAELKNSIKNNIWVKRPGTGGILAEDYNKILGKTTLREIQEGEHLDYKDFE